MQRRVFAAALCCGLLGGGCSKMAPVKVGRVVIDAPHGVTAAQRDAIRKQVYARLSADSSVDVERDRRDATHVLHLRIGQLQRPGAAGGPDLSWLFPQTDADSPPAAAGGSGEAKAGAGAANAGAGGAKAGAGAAKASAGGAAARPSQARPALRPVEVRLAPRGDAARFDATGRGGGGSDVVAATMIGFDDAWHRIQHERRLEHGKDTALIAALKDADPQIRAYAISRLGERRSKAAVLPLCAVLQHEKRPDLVLRAVGSLVSIGDRRAVEPLIKLSRRQSPAVVLQIIYAVGAIGGRMAEAFLVTLASGYPNEQVQKGAKEALHDMDQRRQHAHRAAGARPSHR